LTNSFCPITRNIELRSLVDSVVDDLDSPFNNFIVGLTVFNGIVELVDSDVHADITAFKSNCDCLVTFIELVYRMYGKINLSSLLVKSVSHIFHELFFEIFIIHNMISFLFTLALDCHPRPG